MLTKLSTFRGVLDTGEPLVQVFPQGGSIKKYAGRMMPDVQDWLRTYTSDKENIAVLVSALGATEYYGGNSNGDHFRWGVLCHDHTKDKLPRPIDSFTRKPIPDYGYRTFMDAHAFAHHRNDPDRAFGDVEVSCLNRYMRRVELVVLVNRERAHAHDASSVVDRLDANEYPDVSMGCRIPYDTCFPAGTLIRTAGGYRPVEIVSEGDLVLTHTGSWERVRALGSRKARLMSIKASGVPETRPSEEHPYLIIRKEDARTCQGSANGQRLRHKPQEDGTCKRCGRTIEWEPQWITAEELKPGDYLLSPLDRPVQMGSSVGVPRARMLGYYLGDGHIISQRCGSKKDGPKKDMGFGITVGSDSSGHFNRLMECLREADLRNDPKVYDLDGRNASVVNVYDQATAAWLQHQGGRGSRGKYLSMEVFDWPDEEKLSLLGGYIDTDGCWDKSGTVRMVTVSRGLALDIQRLCHTLGVLATVHQSMSRGGFSEDTNVYTILVPASSTKVFVPYSVKSTGRYRGCYAATRSFFWGGYWCTPIQSVELLDDEEEVYNITVANDESYVAEGVAVHNCLICGNKSKTRNDYCDCIKRLGMGTILPNGEIVGVDNPHPRFFDISFVFIGADKSAKVMVKLGSGIYVPRSVIEAEVLYGADDELEKNACGQRCDRCGARDRCEKFTKVASELVSYGPVQTKAAEVRVGGPPVPNRSEYPFVGTIHYGGLVIHVENRAGDVREGTGPGGKKWRTKMLHHYGEIVGTKGVDRDKLDVYVGPVSPKDCKEVYVVHQNFPGNHPTKAGKYDEDKVFVGFASAVDAKEAYLKHYDRKDFFRSITTIPFRKFKEMIMGEVKGEKVAEEMSLEDLFTHPNLVRREKIWRDKVTGKEEKKIGSGTTRSAAMQKTAGKGPMCGDGIEHLLKTNPEKVKSEKKAADKSAEQKKWAEILKRVDPEGNIGRVIALLNEREADIPKDVLDQMGSGKLEQALSTPSCMGMALKPREFQRIILIRIGKKDLADKMDEDGEVFKPTEGIKAPCEELDPSHLSQGLMQALMPLLEGRSYFGPVASRRVIRIKITPKVAEGKSKEAASPLLSDIGDAYNWYRMQLIKVAADADTILSRNPELNTAVQGVDDTDLFNKEALSRTAWASLGAVPTTMLYSAHLRHEGMTRRPLGPVETFVANHPYVSSLAAAGGLKHLLSSEPVQIGQAYYRKAMDLAKKGL